MPRELENWTKIHPDFGRSPWNKTYQQLWQEKGFSREQAQQYLDQGFTIQDFMLLSWLKDGKQLKIEEVKKEEIASLRKDYQQAWTELNANFAKEHYYLKEQNFQQIWEKNGIDYPEAKKWNELEKNELKKNKSELYLYWPLYYCWPQKWIKLGFTYQNVQSWLEVEFGLDDFKEASKWKEIGTKETIEWITAGFTPQDYWKVREWKKHNFTPQQTQTWLKSGLGKSDYKLVTYLRWKEVEPNSELNFEQLEEELRIAQNYLDCLYSTEQTNEINISKQNLVGSLDLTNFNNLKKLTCSRNKLTVLKLTSCKKLEELNCANNQLIRLILPIDNWIRVIDTYKNLLTAFDYDRLNPDTLTLLEISNNNLSTDLVDFSRLINLERLIISNNLIKGSLLALKNLTKLKKLEVSNTLVEGSLEPLKNLIKLERLEISDTDLNAGVEYLPVSINELGYFIQRRPDCQLIFIIKELEQFDKNRRAYLKSKFKQSKQSKKEEIKEILKSYEERLKPLQEKEEFLARQVNLYERNFVPHLQELLGSGGFASVHRASWKGQQVAVKKSLYNLGLNPNFQKELDSIKKEVELLKRLRNRYIIQYYEFYQEGQEFMIIIELAEQGSLTDYIKRHKDRVYTANDWKTNYNFIKQMTLGLSYLHQSNIIHCDLKSMNILICEGNIAKISDFGISQVVDNLTVNKTSSKGSAAGTLRWKDPYLYKLNKESKSKWNKPCFETDIYALGMIIWEIVAKKIPYEEYSSDMVLARLVNNFQEEIPLATSPVLKTIIVGCWEHDFSKRISLEQITKQIEAVLKVENATEQLTQNKQINWEIQKIKAELNFLIEQPPK